MKKTYFSHLKWAVAILFMHLGTAFNPIQAQVDFIQSNLNFGVFGPAPQVTSLTFGPDGRLYVLDYTGTVYALTVQRNAANNYVVTAKETITGVKEIVNHDDDGEPCSGTSLSCNSRESTGLAVAGTAANPILYVTSSDFRIGSGSNGGSGDVDLDTNSGTITRLSWNGSAWDVVDLVRGLPRSEENHATNGLEFTTINGNDYLIVAQGGHANGGAPSINFSFSNEYALSAAILSIDLTMLNGMPILDDNGRSYIYDLPTLDDPTRANVNGITDPNNPAYNGVDINDPFGGNDGLNQAMVVPNGPVQIFSPGFRNPYDLVVTESGALYTTDNGANQNWGGLPVNEGTANVTNAYDPNETGNNATKATSDGEFVNNLDHLQLITTNLQSYTSGSFYGGHPNPTRANPNGAGLFTAPENLGLVGSVFRTQKYDPDASTSGSTSNASIALPANWPPVASANPVEGDWRGPGISNPDGPDDNPITTWPLNTNGIDEYTASNFGGAMKGNLIAGTSQGMLRRVELKADGTLENLTLEFQTGIGGNTLGISCNSDTDIFPGTIWTGTLNRNIVVFEPSEGQTASFPLRINTGGAETTHSGELFEVDQYFVGGTNFTNSNAQVPVLYQTEHYQSEFSYNIPGPNGDYTVILHFAEIFWGATGGGSGGLGSRIFDVSIEDALVLDNYDIFADVGAETPVTKTFEITVNDGELTIDFSALAADGGVDFAKVSAIEILYNGNIAPVAVANATPLTGVIPLEVTFTGENSTDDVGVTTYQWDFKDGTSNTNEANPVHTFTAAGTYEVELTVGDVGGLTHSTSVTIVATASTIENEPPVAVVSATPTSGNVPLEVTFSGADSSDDLEIVSYLWDFDDGTPTSNDVSPTHSFENAGVYEISLTVEDEEGRSDNASITITVIENPIDNGNNEMVATLFANPTKDIAQVRILQKGAINSTVTRVSIHDVSGRLVRQFNPKDLVAHGLYEIPIATLSGGLVYYLGFEMSDGQRIVFDLIVNN